MKILTTAQIREADTYTIKNEPVRDIDLMERAATTCFYWLMENISPGMQFRIFSGTGNNGGDGLVIARMLHGKGYDVEVFLTGTSDKMSENCKINFERLLHAGDIRMTVISDSSKFPALDKSKDVVIDALFGSGITREITGIHAALIDHINASQTMVVSIDLPSGMPGETTVTFQKNPAIIRAMHTLTFAPPKLALFFPENERFIGDWHLLDIGILGEYIDNAPTKNFMVERNDCQSILRVRKKFSHKGHYGHALLICGGMGKMGAALLCARACIRSGAGLVTAHIPASGRNIMQTAVPEVMLSIDRDDSWFSEPPESGPYNVIGTGPGLGMQEKTQQALKLLIQNTSVPMIFDADAINILSENRTWSSFLPKGSILTPHPKEFERLTGKSSNDYERNQRQRDFSVKHGVYLVLKGAHTAISTPEGSCYFNTTGNPGMATGGSGDVLTGIITGLKARGYSSLESCILGVYLHGLSGDLAAEQTGQESLTASDLVEHLGKSFISLYGRF